MNLKGIISISGKPGLFKVVAQGKNTLIVESLIDGKRFPAYSSHRVSALEDISMYTVEEDVPLGDIIRKIYDKENGGTCIDAKAEAQELHDYFEQILPNYDKERVYNSDLKKLFSWYNLLQSSGTLKTIDEEEKAAAAAEEKAEKPAKKAKEAKAKDEDEAEKPAEKEKKEAKPKKAKTADKDSKKVSTKAAPKAKSADSKAKTSIRTTAPKRGA